MKKAFGKSKSAGMSLVEVVIGSSIILTGILATINAYSTYIKFALQNENNLQAAYLLEEGYEAVSLLRDQSWSANIASLSATTTYYLAWNASTTQWTATTVPQYVDGSFLRSFTVSPVNRDANDRIAQSGTYDPGTKRVDLSVVFYKEHATTTATSSGFIADIHDN